MNYQKVHPIMMQDFDFGKKVQKVII